MHANSHELEMHMRAAIDAARAGVRAGQTPFGCVIVHPQAGAIAAHNEVWLHSDITAHAEVVCLRRTCARLANIDLSGCLLFTTTEPCPMCAAACHWARIDTIYYGASIADAAAAGFNELALPCRDMLANSATRVVSGVLVEECRGLFTEWRQANRSRAY